MGGLIVGIIVALFFISIDFSEYNSNIEKQNKILERIAKALEDNNNK